MLLVILSTTSFSAQKVDGKDLSGNAKNNDVYLDLSHYSGITGSQYKSGNNIGYSETQIQFLFKWDGKHKMEDNKPTYKTGYFLHLNPSLRATVQGGMAPPQTS